MLSGDNNRRIISALLLSVVILSTVSGQPGNFYFTRTEEPVEKAFSLLVPKGWITEGGAIRILDPNVAGANNMVDCKFDLTVKKDREGSVMIRWMPEMMCIDQSYAWGNPEGAVFNNTLVRRKRDPVAFLAEVAIPYAHPGARNVKLITAKQLPSLAELYSRGVDPAMRMVTNMSYYAAMAVFRYEENGNSYEERMITVIEDYGNAGGGLWKNRQSMLFRCPEGEMNKWEPVFNVIQNSGIWNLKWIAGEINGQRQRSGLIAATQKELQEIDNAINESRRKTYSEINKDMYLTLTGQNEYANPFTGKIETDTDSWKNRWINQNGDIIYSDNASYNPNSDPSLQVTGFKRSTPRQ